MSIHVTDNGDTWLGGPACRNADGFNQAAINHDGDCVLVVGFEGQYRGGDQDFNDIQLTVSGPLRLERVL